MVFLATSFIKKKVIPTLEQQCKNRLLVDVYILRVCVACAAVNRECVPIPEFPKPRNPNGLFKRTRLIFSLGFVI